MMPTKDNTQAVNRVLQDKRFDSCLILTWYLRH